MTGGALPAFRRSPLTRADLRHGRRTPAVARSWSTIEPAIAPPDIRHPLADDVITSGLRRRADEIETAFARIEPTLQALAPHQFDTDFPARATSELADRLGLTLPPQALTVTWLAPLDMRTLHARVTVGTFCRLVERAFDRDLAQLSDGESAAALIERWGFHAIDITPCADGRLSGVVDYILRVPPAVVVSRQSYAGAMFDVEETLRRWETVELRRWREGRPNPAGAPTRFLKIGVYHYSHGDSGREGCAAHGSNDLRAASALLERLEQFEAAITATHSDGAAVATLLIGVDTDTDAIRVHVPDAQGRMAPERFVDNRALYESTREMPRATAKDAIRDAVAACAGVAADDVPTEGMRWFCGYLLKNNIGQVDAVKMWHGGSYADRSHTERLIVVGDAVDDVQLRNLAFQAQMTTLEEGAADLDVGVRIVSNVLATSGFAVPVLVHFGYDPRIPGADERARVRATRLQAAIVRRYAHLADSGRLYTQAVVRGGDGAALVTVDSPTTASLEYYG